MGDLVVLEGSKPASPRPKNDEMAAAMRKVAAIVENSDRDVASFGFVIAYRDGTIGLEYGGIMLTTLLGGATAMVNRIERDL